MVYYVFGIVFLVSKKQTESQVFFFKEFICNIEFTVNCIFGYARPSPSDKKFRLAGKNSGINLRN